MIVLISPETPPAAGAQAKEPPVSRHQEAAPPPAEPAASEVTEGSSPVETGGAGGEVTHWTNEREIGLGEGPVTAAQLLAGTADPSRWLHYGGDYANFRHSPVDDLTPESVGRLQVAWSFPTGTPEQFEVSPVIHDGHVIRVVWVERNLIRTLTASDDEPG